MWLRDDGLGLTGGQLLACQPISVLKVDILVYFVKIFIR